MEEGGPTALGPALIVALSMASHHPGSKVILCTDGKANVGLGRVEDPQDGEQEPSEFYETISESASSKGLVTSLSFILYCFYSFYFTYMVICTFPLTPLINCRGSDKEI